MRIIHADSDDLENPLRGGQPIRTYEVNKRLSSRHDIEVLTATYAGCSRRQNRGRIRYRRLGLTVPGLGLSPHLSYLAMLGLAVRRLRHDLVVEEFGPPIGFALLPWWTRKPVVSLVQWFFFEDWERRYRLPFERIMRSTGARARYPNFIVQTERMRDYFADLCPQARIWKLGCGVADDVFDASGRDGGYAVFVGRLDVEHKGLDLLMEAWAQLHRAGQAIPLRIVGEGPGRVWLEQQIALHGLAGCVSLLGRLEGEQKRQVMHDCSFVVMPSRYETFGIVAVEAMAASKPVVAFDIDHLNEVLRPGWAVLAGRPDAGALAEAVLALWGNPARRRLLGEQAYLAAQPRRWDAVAAHQEDIYLEIAGRHHGR